jgi:hypothetical protein
MLLLFILTKVYKHIVHHDFILADVHAVVSHIHTVKSMLFPSVSTHNTPTPTHGALLPLTEYVGAHLYLVYLFVVVLGSCSHNFALETTMAVPLVHF